jgi:hypothetical protein
MKTWDEREFPRHLSFAEELLFCAEATEEEPDESSPQTRSSSWEPPPRPGSKPAGAAAGECPA